MDNNTTKRKRNRQGRLPHGFGSVHKIGGNKNRRNPWRARVFSHIEFDAEKGTATRKFITIGYFPTRADGLDALANYRKNPYTLEAAACTFADVFDMWKVKKFADISKGSVNVYMASYKSSTPLHNMKMRDIRTIHLEQIMNSVKTGYQSQLSMKTLWGQLFKYALEHDIVEKNYAEFVKTRDKAEGTKRTAIPPEVIEKFWKAIDEGDEDAEIAMIYIYTGFRLTELLEVEKETVDIENRIIVGGKKTAAGKDRRVPIHKCILPFIEKRMQQKGDYLITGRDKYEGKPLSKHNFAYHHWNKLMDRLGLEDLTPHYARHTFATMLRTAGIDEDLRKLLMGHANGDITDRYTHHPDSMLIEAIDKLPGRE